jgi:cobalt/nickel transport system permease protein
MASIEKDFFNIRYLDTLARQTTWVHCLDPRAKLLTTLVFIVTVVSFDKYTIAQMIPFVLYPVVLIGMGRLPAGYILRKILLVAPFAIVLGMFNPFFDRTAHLIIGSFTVSGGWVSFGSLLLRFGLTVCAALVFIALTSFNGFCLALEKFRVPEVFIIQLLLLYRYLFVLVDEAMRMVRARALKTFSSRGMGLATFSTLVGHLLLRATSRAERIHLAMSCRGFDGHVRLMNPTRTGSAEIIFVLGWSILFLTMRMYNIPVLIGTHVLELLQ